MVLGPCGGVCPVCCVACGGQGGTLEAMTAHVEAGYLGRKAGKGFFLYKDGKSTRELNPGAVAILAKYSTLGWGVGGVAIID